MTAQISVAAIVPAAGMSRRMGTPKQLLPWGTRTVIATVVANLIEAGCDPVVVVTGHKAEAVSAALTGMRVQIVPNPDYAAGEMLSSYRCGVRHLSALQTAEARVAGALFALGDQPHIPVAVIRDVVEQARKSWEKLVIPSHSLRRGHPFYVPALLWQELMSLGESDTLRTLVRRHEDDIVYVESATDAILKDMDTPQDYAELGVWIPD